ncbi:MAG: peptidoglycan recognition protein family protein, partial [Nocardioides sp.]
VMHSSPAGRRRAAAIVAAVLTWPLMTTVTPSAAAARPDSDGVVRLTADLDSSVRSAETTLAPGLNRLRTSPYSQVAATWRGTAPQVSVRTAPGQPWLELPPLADGPDRGSVEGTPGVSGTDLLWTGPHTGLDVRVRGTGFTDLELVLIEPGSLPSDDAPSSARATTSSLRAEERPDSAPEPNLYTRRDWGANNAWRNGRPVYLRMLKQVHVHHTATGNRYSRADVPGLIRGMYRYHTKTLGWFDIGYNFLVDRFGRAWVGRSGGPRRLVRGAHTLGFNHASVGVAVIGNLESRRPWDKAVMKLRRLAAWKLDSRDRRATGKVSVRSSGSDKYADGERVRLPAIDGHRDTNDTACPGQKLYDRLPGIRRRTQARMDAFSPPD